MTSALFLHFKCFHLQVSQKCFPLSVHKIHLFQDTTLTVHQTRDSGSKCGPDSPEWYLYLIPLEVDPPGSINLLWGPHQTCNTCIPLARFAPGFKSLADIVECHVYKRCHLFPGEWWLAFHLLKWNYILHSNDLPVQRMMCTLLWLCEDTACGQMFSLNSFLCSMRGFELITVTGGRILSGSDPIFEYFQWLLYIAFYCSGMKNQCELQRRSLLHANWEPFRGQLNPKDLSSPQNHFILSLTKMISSIVQVWWPCIPHNRRRMSSPCGVLPHPHPTPQKNV